ncbi:MAG: TraR/DksA C4-type zinc finger protein [Bacteroidetes bacterium]|nr:TraR/DksA C4-type zinc finger protein [Bacteroidota bacterium]
MRGKEFQRVKAALLSELDVTLQKCCHQRLKDVVNDLQIHHAGIKPDASPDEVFAVFLKSGVLKTMTGTPIVRMRESLERLKTGTFGLCASCGRNIPAAYLEKYPTATRCASCDRQAQKLMRPANNGIAAKSDIN